VFNLSHASFFTACFLEKKYEFLKFASQDKIHEINRMINLPELFEVQKFALENKAFMSTLSGSGSSFFSLAFKDDALA
ncbi:homoserine kinase, partial [Campylobacter jejuni]|nr:homoserine kinase [Campylobacter jejuni]